MPRQAGSCRLSQTLGPLRMTRAEFIAALALVVSALSFGVSVFSSWRDRARLVTSSRFIAWWDDNDAHVNVFVVNTGRRPLILRMWVGAESKDNWVGTYLGTEKSGLRLGEHERHEFKLKKQDLLEFTPDGDVSIQDLWFEDTLGRRHLVKGARENLAKLRAS